MPLLCQQWVPSDRPTHCSQSSGTPSSLTPQVEKRIREFTAAGLRPLDAAHLAFAEAAVCDVLLTCDDRFAGRAGRTGCLMRILTPVEYWSEVGDA